MITMQKRDHLSERIDPKRDVWQCDCRRNFSDVSGRQGDQSKIILYPTSAIVALFLYQIRFLPGVANPAGRNARREKADD